MDAELTRQILDKLAFLIKEVKEIKELQLNGKADSSKVIERIINFVNNKREMCTTQVMDEFHISRPHALKLMKDAEKNKDNIIFVPGNSRNESVIRFVNSENKLQYVPLLIIKDMKGDLGSTKTINGLMKRYDLNLEECREVVISVSTITGGKIGMIQTYNNYTKYEERRIKNYRLK